MLFLAKEYNHEVMKRATLHIGCVCGGGRKRGGVGISFNPRLHLEPAEHTQPMNISTESDGMAEWLVVGVLCP